MRTLVTSLGIGMLLLAGCGSSDSNKDGTGTGTGISTGAGTDTGTGAGTGTGTGAGTGTGTGIATITPQGSCANLTCLGELAEMMSDCTPSGSCTRAIASLTSMNLCYSNGVKMGMTANSASATTGTITVKNDSRVCYTAESSTTGSVFKNASGKIVATIGNDATTGAFSITCADGSAGMLDSTCGTETTGMFSTASGATSAMSACTQGACSF